ncbi:fumarylacetoacetate hydrolase family protein [uncultured Desulfosarcina sp.]|uniref:fumarylacetoacetate hydrolase family protein n=1 Tax=uncultured Desulfosarcina sp. TaxID=218289 RepID=UPI0029C7D184|nr:fumarylacetoacetate hydrolase family protein [uncultured Desulfosarcina sp.]
MMITLPIKNSAETYTVDPSKLIALGLNYRAHIAESVSVKVKGFTSEVPPEPLLFPKTPNVLVGPDAKIVIPAFLKAYGFEELRTDYEAELAVIIGRRCKDVPAAEAMTCVLGYTCMNDVSQRNIQNGDRTGWFRGKSLDTFGPIGPQVVLAEDLPDPQNLEIRCRLNGQIVQEGHTSQMIFTIPEIIAFVSKNFTLEAGDIILTGTPAGVGPLHHGDSVEVEIERIGVLKNTVVDETR